MHEHQRKGMEWKHAKTQVEHSKIEREHGVHYTELLRLPYFDTAHFSVIDPMHNILLGTTKLMVTIWKEKFTHDFQTHTKFHLDSVHSRQISLKTGP